MLDDYIVSYAKITIDKDDIQLQGVYFGGYCLSHDEAIACSKLCSHNTKGNMVLTTIYKVEDKSIIDALYDCYEKFEKSWHEMCETNTILRQKQKR